MLKFEKWALEENCEKQQKTICLLNNDFPTLKFDLEMEGPFCLVNI
jgi:hypothetical protein